MTSPQVLHVAGMKSCTLEVDAFDADVDAFVLFFLPPFIGTDNNA